MRINNKRVIPVANTLYTLLFLGLLCFILLIFVPIPLIVNYISPEIATIVCAVLILLFFKSGPQQVEYNSEGETISIRTKDPFVVRYYPANQKLIDFPKRKLNGYQIKRGLFKSQLYLYLDSKRSAHGTTKVTINISYLNKKEVSDIKRSLTKIIKKNKETETTENIPERENERV